MRADEQRILIARVNRQSPNSHAGQAQIARVDALPRHARIGRTKDATAFVAGLVSIAGKDFVGVSRVDQNASEISVRQIATAPGPVIASVMRQIKSLFRPDVDVSGSRWVLGDDIDRGSSRHAIHLLPGFATIPGNEYAITGGAHIDL